MRQSILEITACVGFLGLLLPCQAQTSPSTISIPVTSSDNVAYILVGESVEITGHNSATDAMTRGWLKVGNRIVLSKALAATGDDDYDYTWTPTSAGEYRLQVGDDLANGMQVLGNHVRVVVLDKPPAQLGQLPTSAVNDVSVQLTANVVEGFDCDHAEVLLDGKSIADGKLPQQVTLPFGSIPTGKHIVQVTAFESTGESVPCDAVGVEVPDRVILTVPDHVTLTKPRDTTKLSVTIADGVNADQIDYICDGDNVGSTIKAPFELSGDLSTFPTGNYQMIARVTTTNGASFDSPPIDLTLVNIPDDTRKEAAARAAAAAQAKALAAAAEAQAQAAEQLLEARQAEINRYAYLVSSPDVEIHAKYKIQGDESYDYTGTITNVGNDTIPEVDLYGHETGFSIQANPPAGSDDQTPSIDDTKIDPLVFDYVLADTYKNLRPGETRQIEVIFPPNNAPHNLPPGYGVFLGPTLITLIGYVPEQ